MPGLAQDVPLMPRLFVPSRLGIVLALVLAAERLPHEAGAILQQVGADLATRAGEGVEGVEVYVAC